MADSSIAITAGSGTSIDTRTEATNGQHRQVVVIGDPSVNAGVAPVDVTNGLSVNVTNSSLTVGTHAVTQSGTWTVQPGNTANTTAWKVDGSAVTQPISIATGVQGISTSVTVTPTVTAGTYATSKVIGGIMTFSSILPATPFGGVLNSITLRFKGSVQTVGFSVAIFTTSPSGTFTDTNTAAIASGDTALLLGVYLLNAPSSVLGTHTIYNLDGIGKAIQGASANLFAVVVPTSGTTASLGSTTDMSLQLGALWG